MRSFLLLAFFFVAGTADAAINQSGSRSSVRGHSVEEESIFLDMKGELRSKTISRIEDYLTGIASMTTEFSQTSSDGSVGSGKFYMKRPGKLRWQYETPVKLLLVSNGKTLTYYDPSVDQVTYAGVEDTLANFVAQKTIQLDGPASRLVALQQRNDGTIRATLIQRKKPDEGRLTLEFTEKPLKIVGMTTVDATGNETVVLFKNQEFSKDLNERLFIFNDPRGVNDRRNRHR